MYGFLESRLPTLDSPLRTRLPALEHIKYHIVDLDGDGAHFRSPDIVSILVLTLTLTRGVRVSLLS
jgi:hypothetical protein